MPYENLSSFTEQPSSGYFSQTATRNTANALIRNCDVYVYKSYGAAYFGDYVHYIDIYWGTTDGAAHMGVWAITNDPGSYADMSQGQHVYLYDGSPGVDSVGLHDFGTAQSDFYQVANLQETPLYLTIERSDTTLTCKIYSDSERTDLLDTLTITCANTAEEYALCGNSRESASSPDAAFNGYCENFDIGAPIELQGSTTGTSGVSGSLNVSTKLYGLTTGVLSIDGFLNVATSLVGLVAGVSGADGSLHIIKFAGFVVGVSDAEGSLDSQPELQSSATGTSDISGDLSGVSFWISPIDHNLPGELLYGPTNCYDDDLETATTCHPDLEAGDWTPWIELIPPLLKFASKARFYISPAADLMDFDIYYDSAWYVIALSYPIPVFWEWFEIAFGGSHVVTKVRVRLRLDIECLGAITRFYEFDFWGELLPTIELQGSSTEQSTVSGFLKFLKIKLESSADGISGANGSLNFLEILQGSATGVSGASGSLDTQPELGSSITEITGVSGSLGSVEVAIQLIGFIDEILSVNGVLDVAISLIGSTNETLNVNGVFNIAISLVGSIDEVADIDGWLGFLISIIGSTAGVSGVAGRFEPVLIGFYESLTNQITSYFNAFADANDLAVRYDNDPRPTPSSGLWCECGVDFGSTEQSELGVDSFRNVSNFNIRIKNSIGLGTNELLEKADIVATTFRRKNLNRIIFKVPRIVKVGRIEDNYQVNVICPFFVDKVSS